MCKAGIWGKQNPALGLGFGFVIFKNLSRLNRNPIAASFRADSSNTSLLPDLSLLRAIMRNLTQIIDAV
jgi:hypothetical protein